MIARGLRATCRVAPAVGAFTIAMAAPAIAGGQAPPLAQVAASLVIAILAVIYGRSLATFVALPPEAAFAASFVIVVGLVALSLVHLSATAALRLSAVHALWIDVLVAAVLAAVAFRASKVIGPARSEVGESPIGIAADAVALVCIAGIASVWAREAITAFSDAQASGVFWVWQDYFLHATEITYVRDYATYGGESFTCAACRSRSTIAQATPCRHCSRRSVVPVASGTTAFWLPLGLTLCGFAAYGLGAAVGGRAGGVAAAAVLFLVPDASRLAGNPWFSFFWLVQTGGGPGYAIAVSMIALALLLGRTRAPVSRPVLAAVVLAACAAPFRVHIAAVAVPVVWSMALAIWPASTRKKLLAIALVAMLGTAAALAFERITLAPHFFTARPDSRAFFTFVLAQGSDQGASIGGWRTVHRGGRWSAASP